MNYIQITNTGEIQPQALHLLGASSKTNDDTKIGQFGSGNKYAMAYLLRNDYQLKVYSGVNEIEITTKTEIFREQEYELIYIDGEKTSITTQMGKDWKFWQALREIYCNAMDEGEFSINFVQEIKPVEGQTHFYIDTKKDVMPFMSNFDNYFSTKKKVIFECEYGQILERTGNTANLYRKGIRCFETNKTGVYDYNLFDIQVGEDRLVMFDWYIPGKIWKIIFKCEDSDVIKKILHNVKDHEFIEGSISDFSSIDSSTMSDAFKDVLLEMNLAPKSFAGLLTNEEAHKHVILPTKIFNAVRGIIGDENVSKAFQVNKNGGFYRLVESISAIQKDTVNKAKEFLRICNFEIDYDIRIAVFENKKILGRAHNDTILLSETCIESGVNLVVETIIEEYTHLKHDVEDETRSFQDAIIKEFVNYMKIQNSINL